MFAVLYSGLTVICFVSDLLFYLSEGNGNGATSVVDCP